ncbi:MAG: ankyrin repeat domain-containing protein [Candidatus Sericytochromatia bacterium]
MNKNISMIILMFLLGSCIDQNVINTIYYMNQEKILNEFYQAIAKDDIKTIINLESKEGNIERPIYNYETFNSVSPLTYSILFKHDEVSKYFINKKNNLKFKDHIGRNALMLAASYSSKEILNLLFETKEYDLEEKDFEGNTALMYACSKNNIEAASFLIDKNVNLNTSNQKGITPLLMASYFNNKDIINLLISKGVKIKKNTKNNLPKNLKSTSFNEINMINGYTDFNTLKIPETIKLNETDQLVYFSIIKNFKNQLNFLYENNVELNILDDDGNNVLMLASLMGYTDLVKELIEKFKIDVNSKNINGLNAGFLAAYNDHYETLELLINKGLDLSVKNTYGSNILVSSLYSNKISLNTVKLILSKNININDSNNLNQTALFNSINKDYSYSNYIIANYLIDKGANINIADNSGKTPLIISVLKGNDVFENLLINNNADKSIKDIFGKTYIYYKKNSYFSEGN